MNGIDFCCTHGHEKGEKKRKGGQDIDVLVIEKEERETP